MGTPSHDPSKKSGRTARKAETVKKKLIIIGSIILILSAACLFFLLLYDSGLPKVTFLKEDAALSAASGSIGISLPEKEYQAGDEIHLDVVIKNMDQTPLETVLTLELMQYFPPVYAHPNDMEGFSIFTKTYPVKIEPDSVMTAKVKLPQSVYKANGEYRLSAFCGGESAKEDFLILPAYSLSANLDKSEAIFGDYCGITIEVTNTREQPIYDISVDAYAETPQGDIVEYTIRKLDPGETDSRTYQIKCTNVIQVRAASQNSGYADVIKEIEILYPASLRIAQDEQISLKTGEKTEITAIVSNLGDVKAHRATAAVTEANEHIIVEEPTECSLGDIEGHGSAKATWTVLAEEPGTYYLTIVAQCEGEEPYEYWYGITVED